MKAILVLLLLVLGVGASGCGGGSETRLLDDFNRADETPIAGIWTAPWYDGNGARLLSDQLAPHATQYFSSAYLDASYGPDCEAYATVATNQLDGNSIELYVRGGIGRARGNGYAVQLSKVAGAGNDGWRIYRYNAGTPTLLGAPMVGPEVADGDSIRVEILGSTIKGFHKPAAGESWTEVLSSTDGTFTAAGKIAVRFGGTDARIDNVGGGTLRGPLTHFGPTSLALTASRAGTRKTSSLRP